MPAPKLIDKQMVKNRIYSNCMKAEDVSLIKPDHRNPATHDHRNHSPHEKCTKPPVFEKERYKEYDRPLSDKLFIRPEW